MKIKYISLLIFLVILLANNPVAAQSTIDENEIDSTYIVSVNMFVDNWHHLASIADPVYFDKIAKNGIYIGTDASELWTHDEFYIWAKKYFDRGKAWSFTVIERNVYFSIDKQYSWFDELLNTGMGVCRASGVLHRIDNEWKIEHYHLSIAIPNEDVEQIKTIIREK